MLDGEPMKNLMHFAHKHGALTSLDVTYFPDDRWPDLMTLMPDLDLFCPNLIEATAITGRNSASEAARALVEAGVQKFVAVTDGANGPSGPQIFRLIHLRYSGAQFLRSCRPH